MFVASPGADTLSSGLRPDRGGTPRLRAVPTGATRPVSGLGRPRDTMPAMRRLARRLFTLCSAVSLLLCAAVCVLWVRSYATTDHVVWGDGRRLLMSVSGRVVLVTSSPDIAYGGAPPAVGWSALGFGRHRRQYARGHSVSLEVPHWGLTLACAVAPAISLHALLRARRRSPDGRCRRCGYDLRATPGRCPECGAAATAHRSTSH